MELVVRQHTIEVWAWHRGSVERRMAIHADQRSRAIRLDDEHFPTRFMIWWLSDGVEHALALIPIRSGGLVRRTTPEADIRIVAQRVRDLGFDLSGL
ncbi:hypothetical protein [Microbacterium sp. SORGH_AS_0888]|uniref:hypothetical protein n=1 Tax=Microbacterium sp. SORGH_AS_0888 TaxID=3041791 RepID=UPI002780E481|nr:hypothetical protein [Microbacterium sp. SORGH_AS_0888]MDQ1128263.1 dipeptidyl aminopeptidase/acylaminoacyl peptidase [Microbacterium sp. SORGH_AS_0888]